MPIEPSSSNSTLPFAGIVRNELEKIGVLFHNLFETARDSIILMDGLHFVDCNPATLEMFGCTAKDQILGQTPDRFSPVRQPGGLLSAPEAARLVTLAMNGTPQLFEWRHCRLDRTEFDVEVNLNRCSIAGLFFVVAVVRDITERKHAIAALVREKQFTERLIDSLSAGFYIFDDHLRLRRWNKYFESVMGYSPDELRGKSMNSFFANDAQRDAIIPIARRVLENKDTIEFAETEILHKDGSITHQLISGVHIASPEGPMIIGVGVDVSERIKAESDRERLLADLQTANAAKDQFLAVLSHELRNPLAAILAASDVLEHVGRTKEDQRANRAMKVIQRNVTLLSRFVNDLIDLSRLARGTLEVFRAPVPLNDLVVAAAEICRQNAEHAGVALEVHAEGDNWVDADADRIQQIVINLVSNAIKFTPRGGSVAVLLTAHDHKCRITVKDTGRGLDSKDLPLIFTRFYQGRVAEKRPSGLGIGLPLVKSLTELHDGRVWAESEGTGRGSSFIVELSQCERPRAQDKAKDATSAQPRLRMLLLEDDDDLREMLAENFASLNYEVLMAERGEGALEILGGQSVDIILSDLNLPGMDGYHFLQQARRLPTAVHALAFALSGFGQESDMDRSREAGFLDHFVKPANAKLIDQRIRKQVQLNIKDRSRSAT